MVRLHASRLAELPRAGPRRSAPEGVEGVSDADLALGIQRGDRWAEEAIFRRHVEHVFAVCHRLLRDRMESEDVVQDAFLAAFAQLRSGSAPESLRGWIVGIAVYKVHRFYRRRKLRALLGIHFAGSAVFELAAHAGTSPDLCAELGLLDQALSTVAELDRAAWLLRYVEGYELEEVSRLCRCSLSTAKRRINRARTVVHAHVEIDGVAE